MKIEELKQQADQIRKQYTGRRAIPWPKEFKKSVAEILDRGYPTKKLSLDLEIIYPTLHSWKKALGETKKEKSGFKEAVIIETPKISEIELEWQAGVKVKGLSFSNFKELLESGLI